MTYENTENWRCPAGDIAGGDGDGADGECDRVAKYQCCNPKEIETVSVNTTNIQLPQLQFNKTGKSAIVNDELTLDETEQGPQLTKMVAESTNLKVSRIPYGSIIYHAKNGLTTVFDPDGKQIFTTEDTKAAKVSSPNGPVPATFIQEVPDKSVIVDNGNVIHVFFNKTRILTVIDDNHSQKGQTVMAVAATSYPTTWIEGANTASIATVGHFLADWNIPISPSLTNPYPPSGDVTQGSKITVWNGLETSDGTKLLQPVLEWYVKDKSSDPNPNPPRWSIATWWAAAGQTGIHSTRRYGMVSGDQMQGNMNYYGGYWNGAVTDLTQGISSTLFLTSSQSSALSYRNLQAFLVLEGWDPTRLTGLDARYLSGDVTFNNFIITDINGGNALPSSIGGFVNNLYWNPSTFGLSTYTQSWSSNVILNTAN